MISPSSAVLRAVASADACSIRSVSLRSIAAKNMEPVTPSAAASVGVAQPA